MQIEVSEPVHGDRATVVEALIYLPSGDTVLVSGEALRHPDDKNDHELATLLATGRALERAGKKLTKRADGLVRHNDYLAELKAEQKHGKNKRRLLQKTR